MPKSRAEIQKRYRERKKDKDKEFQLNESRRVLKYYTPASEISAQELQKRRERNREGKRRSRENKKELTENAKRSILKVKIDLTRTVKRRKKMKEKNTEIKSLETRITSLEKSNKKIRKRNERLKAKKKNDSQPESIPMPEMTPKSRTNAQITEAGLKANELPERMKKRLLFTNVLVDEIRDSVKKNKRTSGSRVVRNIISGRIAKKYKIIRHMSKEIGLSRNHLQNAESKLAFCRKKRRLLAARKQLKKNIVIFLERDDNSRMMPGKNDAKKCGAEKVQKRILSDYLYNLRLKYLAENPTVRISRAVFYRMRPQYMQLASFASRDTCLCQKHQNMALLLRAMKNKKIITNGNPDMFIKEKDDQEVLGILNTIGNNDEITYDQWKRVEVEGKQRMKIISTKANKKDFSKKVTDDVKKFREHVKRHHEQYKQLRNLKINLPDGHIILQMDFAENYSCQSCAEVQSAFWNGPTMVSLHPIVAYYKHTGEEEIQHKCFVFVSDELSHNATAIYTILSALYPPLKELVPDINHVHYWTDSPTSQYRNKTIFAILANHTAEFGFSATWNYFEAGHGKGPCDGVGGCAKRMADEAVRSEKVVIDDAHGFFAWATQSDNATSVKYIFYSKEDYQNATTKLTQYSDVQSVPGTMTFHAVASVVTHKIMARTTSCYCADCLANPQESQCAWKTSVLRQPTTSTVQSQLALKVGDFVATRYDDDWYIAKVEEIDPADNEVMVAFMTRAGNNTQAYKFQWPNKDDILWVTRDDVLCVIEPPSQTSKTRKTYSLSSATLELIETRFSLQ